ncbi:MarC family protein [Arenibaculum pallidiluteum]|uniref:MarC family protein n=1 Tax=Arenibaculum pallidiluteum TaxID=2812559 RepID=UPI001A95ED50|nr:MarC family protein [Arenibaculum pallidiluteum]
MTDVVQTFLLAFSALFSIVNPIGAAFIFSQATTGRTHDERSLLARKIAIYSALILLGALWGGTYILAFFGISLPALRMAGGLVVATSAWSLLYAPEQTEARKEEQASHAEGLNDVAFFPLTMPFTTGPGSISVAIALGANRPTGGDLVPFFAATSAAALAVAALVWLAYTWAGDAVPLLGRARARVFTRLSAFILLCIGFQIGLSGLTDYVQSLR